MGDGWVDFGELGVDGGFSENSLKFMIFLCKRVYICLTYPFFGIFGGFWEMPQTRSSHERSPHRDMQCVHPWTYVLPFSFCSKTSQRKKEKDMNNVIVEAGGEHIHRPQNVFSGPPKDWGGPGGWPKKPVLIQDFMWETPGHAKMCQKCPVEPLSNRFFRLPP